MEKIKTAEEFLKEDGKLVLYVTNDGYNYKIDLRELSQKLIEFAKIHVTAALEQASSVQLAWRSDLVIRNAIKDSYPLDNIK